MEHEKPEFLWLVDSRLGAEKPGNPEMPGGAAKKALFPSAKGAGKWRPRKTKNVQTMITLLQPNTPEKNCGSTPVQPAETKWGAQMSTLTRLLHGAPEPLLRW